MKKFISIITLSIFAIFGHAQQSITLYDCLDSASANMPLLKQQDLLGEQLANKVKNYNSYYLPMISLNGQASYQSNVPEFPFSLPNIPSLDIPKFQYRGYVEVAQPLFDGGLSSALKENETAQIEIKKLSLEVGLAEYKKQVARLYFQMLLVNEQQEIITQALELLNKRGQTLTKALENGVVQENDLLKIQSEILSQTQKLNNLKSAEANGKEILSLLCGIQIADKELLKPEVAEIGDYTYASNPEFKLLWSQKASLVSAESMLKTQRMPKVNAFGQAGLGTPNPYNFFTSTLSTYYMVGMRATWNVWDWGRTSRDKKNLALNYNMITEQERQKSIEITSKIKQLETEGDQLQTTVSNDEQLLALREKIRKNAQSQVDQGVITSNDYLTELLNEQVAALTLSIDKISLYQNRILIQLEAGIL